MESGRFRHYCQLVEKIWASCQKWQSFWKRGERRLCGRKWRWNFSFRGHRRDPWEIDSWPWGNIWIYEKLWKWGSRKIWSGRRSPTWIFRSSGEAMVTFKMRQGLERTSESHDISRCPSRIKSHGCRRSNLFFSFETAKNGWVSVLKSNLHLTNFWTVSCIVSSPFFLTAVFLNKFSLQNSVKKTGLYCIGFTRNIMYYDGYLFCFDFVLL